MTGFYDVVLSKGGWRVKASKTIHWPIENESAGIGNILPSMKTDITLDYPSTESRIVIGTKFNAVLKSGWYREETLRNAYMYQIYAYLRSQEGHGDPFTEKASDLSFTPRWGVWLTKLL